MALYLFHTVFIVISPAWSTGEQLSQLDTVKIYYFIVIIQGSRIDDQRTSLPDVITAPTVPDEDFFSLLQRIQSDCLDEQRSKMPKTKVESEAVPRQKGLASSSSASTSNPPKKGSKKDKNKKSSIRGKMQSNIQLIDS